MLNEFYDELNYNTKTKLYVVRANEFNAFALPDNSIFVFDEVLRKVGSYQELAALLGHEYCHIKYRHGMKGIAQTLSWGLLGELITGGDHSNGFIENSNLLLTLKNSREFETQSDFGGLELMRQQQIDQTGMSDMFRTMLDAHKGRSEDRPSYLSTHPDTEDRLDAVEQEIKTKPGVVKQHSKLELIFEELTKGEATWQTR